MALDRGSALALALLAGLLEELVLAHVGEDSSFLTGTLETAQGHLKRLVFADADARHTTRQPQDTNKRVRIVACDRDFAKRGPHREDPPAVSGTVQLSDNTKMEAARHTTDIVLGIETSCDETAVAVYDGTRGLRAHALHSQAAMHAEYGGVVPELAARDHIGRIQPLLTTALDEAGLGIEDITALAYTAGPGLIGALLVGASFASGLAAARDLPLIPVHHLEGHLLAPMLEQDRPEFPFVALLVSGGHTLLVEVAGVGRYRILGETLDDAAGEAFDKTAKLLGLAYPGGPGLAKLARQGHDGRFRFKRPMTDRPGLDLARAFEEAVTETLSIKCRRALQQTGHSRLVVAGGVGANRRLRERLAVETRANDWQLYFPQTQFCTDNAAMIAYAGWARLADAQPAASPILARARWSLSELAAPGQAA